MVLPYNLNRLGGQHKRPYYCEVEYLESDGYCYINTDWVQGSDYDMTISFATPSSASQTIAGARNSNTRNGLFYWNNNTGLMAFTIAQSNSSATPFQLGSLSGDKLIRVKVADNKGSVWIDKVPTYTDTSFSGTYTQTNPLTLFGSNNDGNIEERGVVKIRAFYGVSATSGKIDLVPVLDWDMKPCFYDRARNRLLYNGGTGTFTVGRQIHLVDYLETLGDGEEYFDTGFTGDQDTELSITAESRSDAELYAQVGGRLVSGQPKSLTLNINNSTNRGGVSVFGNQRSTSQTDEVFWSSVGQKSTFMSNKTGFYQDGVQKLAFGDVDEFSTSGNLWILRANGSSAYKAWRWYGAYIKWQGEYRRDLVPMIDGDCVCCAFDKVYHKIYDNAGTGTFKHSDLEIDQLDNTHLTGSQSAYIQTGVTFSYSNAYKIIQDINVMPIGQIRFSGWNAGGAIGINQSTKNYRDGNTDLVPAVKEGTRVIATIRINSKQSTQTYYNVAYGMSTSTGTRQHSSISGYATLGYPLMISTTNSNGYQYQTYGLLGKVQIYSGSSLSDLTLVRDMKPIVRNGKAGLLDTLNNVFYSSAGDTQFKFRAK